MNANNNYANKKATVLFRCLIMAACMLPAALCTAQVNEKPFTVPEVTQWHGGTGETRLSGRIVVKSKNMKAAAEALIADCQLLTGHKLTLASGKPQQGDIVFTAKKLDSMPLEGYRIDIGTQVCVDAPSAQGAYWATRTLLQLMDKGFASEATHAKELPALKRGEMVDVPQYRLRGFMLDCGRKYIPMHYLQQLVKVMAYYKMNTLQLHLNDNGFRQFYENDWTKTQAAFRLQCDTYPGLTARDGSYTKQEFIDLQKLAEACHVEIIPEIDAPAHALAFTHYKPELGSKEFGMDHFDLSNPDVYTFMDGLFKEYLEGKEPVFRGPRVNIGTDEYSNARPELVEQFRTFTDHYLALIQSYGKQPMLWGSLTHAKGNTPVRHEGVLMSCWSNGFAVPDSMKQLGYQLVSIPDGMVYIVPAAGYYQDYLNCERLYNNWTPAVVGNQTFTEQDPQIEGGMFAVWNDHAGNGISVKDIHHRLFPAMQTMATKCWTGKKTTFPYTTFNQQRLLLSEAPGVNELAQLPATPLTQEQVLPNAQLSAALNGISEAGYNSRIAFDIDCAPEERGTIFTTGINATFYLSDPQTGALGFARDGYLYTFNYRLPQQGRVSVAVECTNTETRLFINGHLQQRLPVLDVVSVTPNAQIQNKLGTPFMPTIYRSPARMKYVQTLVFPLQQTGNFKAKVTNLRISRL